MSLSLILTTAMCETAMKAVLPLIETMKKLGYANKFAGTLVVLDPRNGAVIYQYVIDPEHEQVAKYTDIAHHNAKVSWETGLPSRLVQQNEPWAYEEGDTKYGGSAVRGVGNFKLVVAFSGVQAVFDEVYSNCYADVLVGLCIEWMSDVVMPNKGDGEDVVFARV